MVGLVSVLLLKARPTVRLIAASILIGACAGLYTTQLLALVLTDPMRPVLLAIEKEAKSANVPFDGRTRIEAISELRTQGVIAYPPFYPYLTLESPLRINGEAIIPLASLAHARTVCCNEDGQYFTYTTDEHGFVNPPDAWSDPPVDIALVGASAAVGESVPAADSLVSQFRARYPKVVSLGAGGNGPLLELASLREYAPALKPKRVVWIFGEARTPEYLETESHSQFLLRYLDRSFRQGLLEKQDALNQAIATYFEEGIRIEQSEHTWARRATEFIMLKNFRELAYFYVTAQTAKPKPFEFNSAVYEQALREGKQNVGVWGGKVTLVYWPDSSRYPGICNYSPQLRALYDRTHDAVLNVAAKLDIPVIDLSQSFPDLPAAVSENTQYFYPYPAHYRPAGYRFAGSQILSQLEKLDD
jgi:hypothetical protein